MRTGREFVVRIEIDWEVGLRTSLSDTGRCNCGRSGWILGNKWPQASWGKTAIVLLCSQILSVRKFYRAQEGGPRSHLERLEWLGRPEAGDWNHLDASSLRHLLPGLGWLEGRAHLGLLSGAPTRGLSPPAWASHCMGLGSGYHVEAAQLLWPCFRRHRVTSTILLDWSNHKPALT